MKNFWTFLMATPKATLMIPLVLILQIAKRFGIPLPCDEKTIGDIVDLITALAGMYGLYHAGRGTWPTTPPTIPPVVPVDKKP